MTARKTALTTAAALGLASCLAAPGFAGEREEWAGLAERVSSQDARCSTEAYRAQSMVRFAVETARARSAGLGRGDASELAEAVAAHAVLKALYPQRAVFFDVRLERLARESSAGAVAAAAMEAGFSASDDALLFAWPGAADALGLEKPPAVLAPVPARPAICPIAMPPPTMEPWWRQPVAIDL